MARSRSHAPRDGELASLIAEVLRPLSVDDALTRLGAAGAPAAPVLTVDATYTDAFLAENHYYDTYVDPAFGPATGIAGFARFERTKTEFRRPPPTVGQHSIDVLRDFGVVPDAHRLPCSDPARLSRARCRPSGVTHSDEQTQCERAGEAPAQGVRTSREGAYQEGAEGDGELPDARPRSRDQRDAPVAPRTRSGKPHQGRVRSHQPQGGQDPREEDTKKKKKKK